MIVVVILIVVIAAVANAAGMPWPAAIVVGIVAPLLASSLFLRATNQNAPQSKLSPNDPRTRRFLVALSERYRSEGYVYGADSLDSVLQSYDAGRLVEATQQFGSLSGVVARHPHATTLISMWQGAWRDSRQQKPQPASNSGASRPRTNGTPSLVDRVEPGGQAARPEPSTILEAHAESQDTVPPESAVGGTRHRGGTIVSYDASKPEDLRVIVANGLVWSSGPKAQQAAVDALVAGTLPMNDRVPAAIRALVEQARVEDEPDAGSNMPPPSIGAPRGADREWTEWMKVRILERQVSKNRWYWELEWRGGDGSLHRQASERGFTNQEAARVAGESMAEAVYGAALRNGLIPSS